MIGGSFEAQLRTESDSEIKKLISAILTTFDPYIWSKVVNFEKLSTIDENLRKAFSL